MVIIEDGERGVQFQSGMREEAIYPTRIAASDPDESVRIRVFDQS